MKNIKAYFWCLALLMLAGSIWADSFTMHVATQRFRDPRGEGSILNIDYQIPYSNLWFLAKNSGYFAEVELEVEFVQADSVVFSRTVHDNIGISNKNDARSNKSHLNRLSFSLDGEGYFMRVKAMDINSRKTANYFYQAEPLAASDLISDLELCSIVRPDSSSYLDRFHRGGSLYKTEPSLIFDKTELENLSLFLEVYAPPEAIDQTGILVLTVEKDSIIVFDTMLDYKPQAASEGLTLRIPLEELEPGKYNGFIDLQLEGQSQEREFIFFITEPKQEQYFVLPDPDDDFKLYRYFSGGTSTAEWKKYDDATKRRYLSQSWKTLANMRNMSVRGMLEQIQERVDYANRYFSYFDQGWTTDMGRIHIRQGKPDEIEKGTSSDEARFVRKDYQIWKYQGRNRAVYLFLDMQMNGNYRLIYVDGDDNESSHPDSLYYLGEDFDKTLLYN